ncbi:TPA: hypothetical protein ACMFP1_002894 [Pseudomonas aeruginosa]
MSENERPKVDITAKMRQEISLFVAKRRVLDTPASEWFSSGSLVQVYLRAGRYAHDRQTDSFEYAIGLSNISVNPKFHCRGVFSRVLEHLEAMAKELNYSYVQVEQVMHPWLGARLEARGYKILHAGELAPIYRKPVAWNGRIDSAELSIYTYPIPNGEGSWARAMTTKTGVAVCHKPSGIEVRSSLQFSVHANRHMAFSVLHNGLGRSDAVVLEQQLKKACDLLHNATLTLHSGEKRADITEFLNEVQYTGTRGLAQRDEEESE